LNEPYGTGHQLPYETQDFWIYVGRRLEESLSYLIPIFEIGGAVADVDSALGNNLAGTYGAWARDQVYEKEIADLGRMQYLPCQLEESLVLVVPPRTDDNLDPIPYTQYRWEDTINMTLYPLTTIAYSFSFSGTQEEPLRIEVKRGGPGTSYKIYKQGDPCDTVPVSEDYWTEEINADDTYVVIVANGNHTAQESHRLHIRWGREDSDPKENPPQEDPPED